MPDLPPPEFDGTGRHLPPFDPTKVRTDEHLEGWTNGLFTDDQLKRLRNIKATAGQVARSSLGPVDDVFGDAAWAADIALEALAEVVRLLAERSEASALLARCEEAIHGCASWCDEQELLAELKRWREARG